LVARWAASAPQYHRTSGVYRTHAIQGAATMSLRRRIKHRPRGLSTVRRYRASIESLEQRWCPAVTATLSAGILSVVGDGTSNSVDVLDSGQGEITVVGDGQRQSFIDVDEIFIETQEGDDKVSYTKVRSLTVTFQGPLHIDVGDGDDQIRISDGPASDVHIRNQATTLSMDLGRGNDGVDVDIHHDDQVDLDIRSSDGGDQIGVHLVAKLRGNTRMDFHLGEGGNLVSIQTRNFDVVDAAIETIASADRGGEALPPDSFSLSFASRIDPAGQHRHFHGFPGRLSVGGTFGDADDQLTIDSQGFEEVVDQLALGGGNDTAHVRHRMVALVDRTNLAHVDAALGDGADDFSLDLDGYHQVTTRVDGGAGDDLVAINQQADHPDLFKNVWINQTELPMGPGNDRVQFISLGYDQVGLTADLGDGDDAVTVLLRRLANPGLPPSADPSSADVTIRMGAGDDNVSMMTHGYQRIATDLDTGPAGDGRDVYMAKYLTLRPRPLDRSSTALDGGSDLSEIVAMGYGSVDVRTEQTRQITLIQDI